MYTLIINADMKCKAVYLTIALLIQHRLLVCTNFHGLQQEDSILLTKTIGHFR